MPYNLDPCLPKAALVMGAASFCGERQLLFHPTPLPQKIQRTARPGGKRHNHRYLVFELLNYGKMLEVNIDSLDYMNRNDYFCV